MKNESENTNIQNDNEQISSVEVIKEEYESKLNEMRQEYESKINEMRTNHIEEIRTLMRTGQAPEDEEYQEEELTDEERILQSLRNKYKLK